MSKVALRKHMEAYEATPKEWKQEHLDAMLCFDVEDSIEFGLFILERINDLDEDVRMDGYGDQFSPVEFAKLCAEIEGLYGKWLTASEVHEKAIDLLEQMSFKVERSDDLRREIKQTRAMLTPDSAYFAGDKLVNLRDEAIESHARGETEEWSRPD